jgi:hypothetical protein
MKNIAALRVLQTLALLLPFQLVHAQQTAHFTQTVAKATSSERIALSPTNATAGTSVQANVTLAGVPNHSVPSGTVTFTLVPADGSAPVTATLPVSNAAAVWTLQQPSTSYSITATYSGDLNYGTQIASTSSSGAVPMDFAFSVDTITVAQGQTTTSPVQVVSIGGFSQVITFSCVSPTAFACTFANASINPLASSSLPVTVSTQPGQFVAAASLFLGAILFGACRKRRRALADVAMAAVVCLTLTLSGCGTSTTVGWQSLTPKGTYQVTITGTAGSLQHSRIVTVIVK